jgi:Rrf2 family protein
MEPLLQSLSRAELVDSVRGPRGGYRLARAPRDIRLAEIVAVALAEEEEASHLPSGRLHETVTVRLWQELDEAVRERLKSLSLDDLLRQAAAKGLHSPATEPIALAV